METKRVCEGLGAGVRAGVETKRVCEGLGAGRHCIKKRIAFFLLFYLLLVAHVGFCFPPTHYYSSSSSHSGSATDASIELPIHIPAHSPKPQSSPSFLAIQQWPVG